MLDGGLGNDALVGGLGDDIYILGAGTDTVTELVGEGTDEIRASGTFNLIGAQFANIERLTLTGIGRQRHRQRSGQRHYRQQRR